MRVFWAYLFTFLSTFSWGESITIPENFQVLKVDNKDHSSSFFESETTLSLSKGRHVLLLRYTDLFDDYDNDDHTKVKSEPFIVVVEMGSSPMTVHSPDITELDSARGYSKSPYLTIKNGRNEAVSHQLMFLADFENQQFANAVANATSDSKNEVHIDTETVDENTLNKPTANELNNTSSLETPTNKVTHDNLIESRALSMLNYWWAQASEKEKKAFLLSIQ